MAGRALAGRSAWPARIVDNADTKIGGPHPGFEGVVERPTLDPDDPNPYISVLSTRTHNDSIAAAIRAASILMAAIMEVEEWPYR